ncbi:MAG: helix-turn-helix domain-containing protein [Streptosporangiaceae bacterium]
MPAAAVAAPRCHRPTVFCGIVQVRYRYRIYPTPGQRQSLARVFGCARVVYNDCLRLRISATRPERRSLIPRCSAGRSPRPSSLRSGRGSPRWHR